MRQNRSEDLDRSAIEALLQSNSYDQPLRVTREGMLFAFALLLILVLRIYNLSYNTLSVDEAIYIDTGYDMRDGIISGKAESWMFGSFLYPMYVSFADQLGGELGVKASSVIPNVAAAVFIYLATRRVFGFKTALWALLLFGLSGDSVNLGRQAVYDALGIALAALGLYWMVIAAQEDNPKAWYFALASAIAIILCFLTKYIGILILPTILMIGAAIYLLKARGVLELLCDSRFYMFVIIISLLVGSYLLFSFDEVRLVLTGARSAEVVERGQVLTAIVQQVGLFALLALIGLVFAAREARNYLELAQRKLHTRLFFVLVLFGLVLTFPLLQLYHLLTANLHDLWKHNLYTLVLIAPLAGLGVDRIITYLLSDVETKNRRVLRLLLGFALGLTAFAFVNRALDVSWDYEYSWPNIQAAVRFLEAQQEVEIHRDLLVLAAEAPVYSYYLHLSEPHQPWSSQAFFNYKGRMGIDGINAAIEECALELVILDDYYTTDINAIVEPVLINAGYHQIYSETQRLHSGEQIGTRMYIPDEHNNCWWRGV